MIEQQIRHRLDDLADFLEAEHRPCPLGRQALLAWLLEQLERVQRVPRAPDSAVTAMIDSGYLRWLDEIERNQPSDQEREELFQ